MQATVMSGMPDQEAAKANTAGVAAQRLVNIKRTPELTPSRESSSLPTLRLQRGQHSLSGLTALGTCYQGPCVHLCTKLPPEDPLLCTWTTD